MAFAKLEENFLHKVDFEKFDFEKDRNLIMC
jgi:hypothetical protein